MDYIFSVVKRIHFLETISSWKSRKPGARLAYALSGYEGTDRCILQITHNFYVRNLGRKVRTCTSFCDICQCVKHPNQVYEIEARSHLLSRLGEIKFLDLYCAIPTECNVVKYILVCLDVFNKHDKSHPIK